MEPEYPLKVRVVVFEPGDTLPAPEIVPATEEVVVTEETPAE